LLQSLLALFCGVKNIRADFYRGLSFFIIICHNNISLKNERSQVMTMDTTNTQNSEQPKKKRWLSKLLKVLGRTALVLLETVVLLVVILYGVMYILAKGPSPTARDIFVMSVRETSAMGFLADLFFTPEEIAAIEAKEEVEDYIETDTSLIVIPTEPEGE
jgi:hypothetical protein